MMRTREARAPKLIFTTPSHQHPTGRLMPVARRTELLAAAEPGKTWIVEDDYDGEFHYDSRPMPALQGLDREGRVLYLGTFAKATTADIRIGYLVVPPQLARTMEIAQRHLGLIASVHVQEALLPSDHLEIVPGSHRRDYSAVEAGICLPYPNGPNIRSNTMPGGCTAVHAPGDALIFSATAIHRGRYHADSPRRT